MRRLIIVCLALLSLCGSASAQDKIRVYLSAPTRDGFVDTSKDIQDSVKDVRKHLSNAKALILVPSPDAADIILTIVQRGVGSSIYGDRLRLTEYYGDTEITQTPMVSNTYWVSAVMTIGGYRKELVGTYVNQLSASLGSWGECAKDIANDLKQWVSVNADTVRAKRARQ